MRLTRHFDSREFDCHDGTPVPHHAYSDLERLAGELLEPLRAEFGTTWIVSGYRTRRYNIAVGGAPNSYHIYMATRPGAAADVRCARGRPAQWYRLLDQRNAGGLGMYSGHVHVDNRVGHARW